MSGSWLACYVSLDNDALTSLSNPGLLRRATKVLASSTPTWEENTDDHGVIKVGDFHVRLDARGPTQGRCPCPTAGVCTHVLAATMFANQEALALGLTAAEAPKAAPAKPPRRISPAETPEPKANQTSTGPTSAQEALLTQIRHELERTVSGGLSHLGESAAERMSELAMEARLEGFALLSRCLNAITTQLESITKHEDDVSELDLTSTIAHAWALIRALEGAQGDAWGRLRGSLRRTFTLDETRQLNLLPLGAAWWVSDSGANGITLTLWDKDAEDIRISTAARPRGTDTTFRQSKSTLVFWNTALSTLLAGPFRLISPRMSVDGKLSPSGGPVSGAVTKGELSTAFTEAELGSIAAQLRPDASQADFVGSDHSVALLTTQGNGQMEIDEPHQTLVWSLPIAPLTQDSELKAALASSDATKPRTKTSILSGLFNKAEGDVIQLRQEITAAATTRINNMVALEATHADVAFVLIQRQTRRGLTVWEPVTVFTRSPQGLIALSLDFDQVTQSKGLLSVLQRRLALWLKRSSDARTPPPPLRSAIGMTCDDIRDLMVEVTATGRREFSHAQKQRCGDLAERCNLLGLTTLAKALRPLGGNLQVGQVLLVHFLADRVSQLHSH